jgi:tripartite-type tricarboxylate transporter receptor subunit TctC
MSSSKRLNRKMRHGSFLMVVALLGSCIAVISSFNSVARSAELDTQAVAEFYKGKTVRIVVGFGPGGSTDTNARLFQKVMSKYIPGNPTIVVENKPGGGSMLAANTVYAAEPNDGTVIAAFTPDLVLEQAIGASGVKFDAAKYQWIGSAVETASMCAARMDSGVTHIEDMIGERKPELVVSSFGKGGPSYIPPAVFNVTLGTRFKIVTGYQGGGAQRLAVKNKEVQGFCTNTETITSLAVDMFEGPAACCRVLVVTGSEAEDHPFFKDVPAAEKLVEKLKKGKDELAMLRAIQAPNLFSMVWAVGPKVPKDRVQWLRRAYQKAAADPELQVGAKKLNMNLKPKTGEEVGRIVAELLGTPKPALAKLKVAIE